MGKAVADLSQPALVTWTDPVLRQAMLLDSQMERLMAHYQGQWVVFLDGKVLASGDTEDDALSKVPADALASPFVSRLIEYDEDTDYMGGPKGE